MSEQGISISELANGPIAAERRISNAYGNGTYIDGGTISPGIIAAPYSNPNRIAMKNRVEVISAGLRFTLQEVTYFLNKSRAPGNTEIEIIDVYNPDKPDVLEGQRLVLEWTSV